MIPSRLVAYYVDKMDENDARKLIKKYGFDFTDQEIAMLLPFVKQHKYELHRRNKDILLSELKKVVPTTTYQKIEMILQSYL
ncbi:unknown [Coprobacillus sp. CAG:826]|nr:DUF2624 family protein [Coprobacillus sp.]CDD91271.1 unknown [Coprobacillus sp. CAG:826]